MSGERRILVVRGGAIGDFIMTLPAIGALRERWPEAHIEILGYPHIAQLAKDRHYADATRSIEARPLAGFFIPQAVLDPSLMTYFGSFQVVLSYLYDPDEVFADNVRRCGVSRLITASPRPTDCPAAEHYCKPLRQLEIEVRDPCPRIYPSPADREEMTEFLAARAGGKAGNRLLVALHPGSGSEKKNWDVDEFTALAQWLIGHREWELILIRGEADGPVVARLSEQLTPDAYRMVAGWPLPRLAALLERCAVYIGNDSGITHLAAAVQCPTIALFGPASVPAWEPVGPAVRVLRFAEATQSVVRGLVTEHSREVSC